MKNNIRASSAVPEIRPNQSPHPVVKYTLYLRIIRRWRERISLEMNSDQINLPTKYTLSGAVDSPVRPLI